LSITITFATIVEWFLEYWCITTPLEPIFTSAKLLTVAVFPSIDKILLLYSENFAFNIVADKIKITNPFT